MAAEGCGSIEYESGERLAVPINPNKRDLMFNDLRVSGYESLPTITFKNTSMNEVHTWICESPDEARRCLRELEDSDHIEVIHVEDSLVKFNKR